MSAAPLASDGCQGRRNALLNDAFKFPSLEVIEARKACFETEAACNQAREAYEAANRAEESAK